jgi:flagellar biosynthesis/type III secretory pathway chaperone
MYANTPQALKAQLEKQLGLLQELMATSTSKQQALVKCRLDELQGLSEQEQTQAAQVAACEERRLVLLRQLQDEGKLDPRLSLEGITLSTLLELLPTSQQPELQRLAEKLASEAEALREINLQNEALTANLLDYTASVMRLLTQENGSGHYTATGVIAGLPGRAMLDSRV